MSALPVDAVLDDLVGALEQKRRAVVVAPPGSGKTTRVPLALLDAVGERGQVVVTQPRRAAARMVARFVGKQRTRGDVGYEVRGERNVSNKTRLRFVTEGVLLAQLLSDPELAGVKAVIIDEFHERSLVVDTLLALLAESASVLREDLWLVVMSATLDAEPVASFLEDCPIIQAEGRRFPVALRYAAGHSVARAVKEAASSADGGDVLAFLPGVREIEAAFQSLSGAQLIVHRLHGSLPAAEQDRVLGFSGAQRVVLATNIAETSVTLPGVTAVVDTGTCKQLRHDASSGLDRLELRPISQASAEQRAGRAGRVRPGTAVRLWSEHEHKGRRAFDNPDIARLDLAPLLLWLRRWGVVDVRGFDFFEAPPEAAINRAEVLLADLGATETRFGPLTAMGSAMARLPMHPRIGRFLLEAKAEGVPGLGCDVAMLLEEPRWFSGQGGARSERADVLARARRFRIEGGRHRQATRLAQQFRRVLGVKGDARDAGDAAEAAICRALLSGWPDRVAARRAKGSDEVVLATGRAARLSRDSRVVADDLLLALRVGAGGAGGAWVQSAAALEWEDVVTRPEYVEGEELRWDAKRQRVVAEQVKRYRDLVLERRDVPLHDREAAAKVLAEQVRRAGLEAFQLDKAATQLLARLRTLEPDEEAWAWVAPTVERACQGRAALSDVRGVKLASLVLDALPWEVRSRLDKEAPSLLKVPSGREARVTYRLNGPPALAIKVQEMFGVAQGPTVGRARTPIRLELLDPAGRPLAVTDDLASFWAGAWEDVRKQMRGRYPKHRWPEDPRTAEASVRTTKPRKR